MNLKIRDIEKISVVDIEGDIDINSAELIEIVGWLLRNARVKIIFNFENVNFVDYSGLSILSIAYKSVANHDGVIKFVRVSASTLELLRLVHLDSVFDVYQDEESALESFCKEPSVVDKQRLRRRFARLDIHMYVEYKVKGAKSPIQALKEKILNISGAGVFIHSYHIYPVNTDLDMEFSIPAGQETISAQGTVVWIADKELQAQVYPGMGVQFTKMDPERYKALLDFIDKNVARRTDVAS